MKHFFSLLPRLGTRPAALLGLVAVPLFFGAAQAQRLPVGQRPPGAVVPGSPTQLAHRPAANTAPDMPQAQALTAWTTVAPLSQARGQHAACATGGNIYTWGGYLGVSTEFASLEIYTPATNTWAAGADLPVGVRGPAHAVGTDGSVYSLSGVTGSTAITKNCYRYTPATNTWAAIAPLPTDVWLAAAATGADGRIFVFGGLTYTGGVSFTNLTQIYTPATNTWSMGAPMPTARNGQVALPDASGRLHVIGGIGAFSVGPALATHEVYDPATNTWTTAAALPAGRNQAGGARGSDGQLYVVGGKNSFYNNNGTEYADAFAYNAATDTWATATALPSARSEVRTVALGNDLYTLGGTDGTYQPTVYRSAVAPAAAPVLTSVSPTSGPVGTSVTLTGTDLTDILAVSFNGTAATVFSTGTGTTATATVPAGATTGDIIVTTIVGPSNGVAFGVIRDLVITDRKDIPAGTYRNITIQNNGMGSLLGDIVVSGALLIESGGTLFTNSGTNTCHRVSGAGTFTLAAGGYLEICDADGITREGNTGTIRTSTRSFADDASYDYTSAGAQVTGDALPGTVAELFSYNDADVTLSQPLAIRELLDLEAAGNLVLAGNLLALLSDADGTAVVVNGSTGIVAGTSATVQRYLDPTDNPGLGYRHYSAPVSGSTVADLTTAGFTPEVRMAREYNLSATPGRITPFPTVFAYDQERVGMTSSYTPFDRGFFVPEGIEGPNENAPLEVGRGYAVQIRGTENVDFTGTLNTGDIDVELNRIGENADAGWALVGNPYPAPIDGALLFNNNNASTGLEESFYVVESTSAYQGMYRAIARNFEGDQNTLIAAGQGFFVRVRSSRTSSTLQFRDAQRLTDYETPVTMQRGGSSAQPTVALALRGATGPTDKLFVYADAQATPGFDSGYDAWKLPNSTGLNLSSRSAQDQGLAIDGRPAFTAATRIALAVGVPAAGTYTISAASLKNMPAGLDAYLSDAATGQTVKLAAGTAYSFSVTAAQSQALLTGRFTLSFSTASALASARGVSAEQVSVYPNPATGRFTVTLPTIAGARTVEATLLNSLGQVVRRQSASLNAGGTRFDVVADGLGAGVYSLRLTAGATTLTKRVVLQ